MNNKTNDSGDGLELRWLAEEQVFKTADPEDEKVEALLSPEMRRMLHELRVHKTMLEMQNEELHRAQAEIDLTRERYFDLFNLAPSGYCTINDKGLITESNLAVAGMLDVPHDELLNQPISRYIASEDQDLFIFHRNNLVETGTKQVCELRLRRADGTSFWARMEAVFSRDVEGDLIDLNEMEFVILVILVDLTETRLIKALKESEERFSLLFERAPLGYQSLDEEGCFIEVNQAWVETLGYTNDEVIGRWFGDFLAPEYVEAFRERFPIFKAQGKIHSEFEMLHKNGERRIIAFDGRIGYKVNGSFKQTHCILQDITEQRRSEQVLALEQKRFSMLFESFPGYICLQAPDYSIRYFNQYFAEQIGDPLGRLCYEVFWGRTAPCKKCLTFKVFETGMPQRFEWKTTNGIVYAVYDHPFIDSDGTELVLEIGIDITAQKKAEEALKKRNSLLVALNQAHDQFISGHETAHVYRDMLDALVESTDSTYGFIDEVLYDSDGTPYKLSLGMSNISWDDASEKLYEQLKSQKLEFRNLQNLAGAPVLEQKVIIANDPFAHQQSGGVPPGHPPLTSYMGIPLFFGKELIGVAGVANRPGGYNEEIVDFIKPLTEACAAMIWAGRFARREEESFTALKASEEKFRLLAETAYEGIWIMNADYKITYVNRRLAEMLGYEMEELSGMPMEQLLFSDDYDDHMDKMVNRRRGQFESYERRLKCKDGSAIWAIISSTPQKDETENFLGSFAMVTDITARKTSEEKVRYLSFHDHLTGLYNRTYLEEEMNRLDTERQLPVSVIMADLNGLKLINDTFGHATGDLLIKRAADIFREACREEDIIARWGGDEFLILLPQTTAREVDEVCNRIKRVSQKTGIMGLPVSIAIGSACKENVAISMEVVIREAEDRMYRHKLVEGQSIKQAVIKAMLTTLEEKSFETEEHIRRMQLTAKQIALKLNLSETEIERLNLLVKLHDIGNVILLKDILLKDTILTEDEWVEIKKHPEIGFRIVRTMEEYANVAEEVLAHHERWDGSGYPRGLKGEEIPLLARIVAICDAYEVLSSGKPYKKAKTVAEIDAELNRCSGTQFDPELVVIMQSILKEGLLA
jgi:diguanylate cyclase (GGDEF)-like protein/PAS domain S-box-containing protein